MNTAPGRWVLGVAVPLAALPAGAAGTARGAGHGVVRTARRKTPSGTAPALAVRDVRVRADGNGAQITYTGLNPGNVMLRPRAPPPRPVGPAAPRWPARSPVFPRSCRPARRCARAARGPVRPPWNGPG
ncbi:hypothetical protein [Streptomyces sp. NPDC054838]